MISVIVPIYNVEKYLRKCINSIVGQTYRDLQIILVDDGSPDNCPSICDDYATKDSRIVVIHQENSGVSAARNAGLQVATGEYIGFVDGDDYIDVNMYDNMLTELQSNNADLAICGYDYVNEDGKVTRGYNVRTKEIIDSKECFKRYFDMPPTIRLVVWNKLFKKELFNGIHFSKSIKGAEDAEVLRKYFQRISKAVFIHEPYCKNCERIGSATRGGLKSDAVLPALDIYMETRKYIEEKYGNIYKHAQAYYMDACLLNYNIYCKQYKKEQRNLMREIRKRIRREFPKAMNNGEIFWKTRIFYLLFGIGIAR